MVNLILKEIELEGFRSYASRCRVGFSEGVNVIVGKNGAGKTSLIEAIYFALTSKALRGSVDDLYNARGVPGAKNRRPLRVRLSLLSDRGEVRVERERPNTMGDKLLLGNSVLAISTKNVDYKLGEILGLKKHLDLGVGLQKVIKTAFVSQGELLEYADMLSSEGKEKKEWIDSQLGLTDYEEAYRKLGELSIKARYENRAREYNVSAQDYKALLEDMQFIESKLRDRESEYRAREEELLKTKTELREKLLTKEELERRMRELREQIELLEAKKRKFDELMSTKKTLESELSRKRSALESMERELKGMAERAISERLINGFPAFREALLGKIEADELLEELGEIMRLLNEGLELARELRGHGLSLERDFRELRAELSSVLYRQISLSEEIAKLRERLGQDMGRLAELIDYVKKVAEVPHIASAGSGEFEEEVSALNRVYMDLINSISRDEAEEKLITARLENLSKSKGTCPVCGSPLDEEHKRLLIEEASAQLRRLRARLNECRERKGLIEGKLTEINNRLYSVRALREKLEELEGELSKLRSRYGDSDVVSRACSAVNELIEVQSALQGALSRESLRRLGLDLGRLRVENMEEIHRRISTLLAEVADKRDKAAARVREITAALDQDAASRVEEVSKDRRLAEAFLRELEARVFEYIKTLNEVSRLRGEVAILEQRLSETEKELSQVSYDREAHENGRRALEEAQAKYTRVHGDIQRLEERARNIEAYLEERRAEIESLRRSLSELREARDKLLALLKVRDLFHRDGIPSKLRAYALSRINEEFNTLLQMFNLNYREASIDEDVNITLRSSSHALPLSQLSGGERIVASLSFLLALRKTVEELLVGKRVFGFLVLDEPTIYLDEDRRASLIEILKEFQGGRIIPQLIIVTHEEDLKESGDNIIYVENNGFSSVARALGEDIT